MEECDSSQVVASHEGSEKFFITLRTKTVTSDFPRGKKVRDD